MKIYDFSTKGPCGVTESLMFAIDLNPLINEKDLTIEQFINHKLKRF